MNFSKKNIIIGAIFAVIAIGFAGYGIIKASSSSRIVVEVGDPNKKENPGLQEQGKSVIEGENKEIFIHIIGCVRTPGVIKIPAESRISDALQAVGGAKEGADLEMVNLAYKLEDGQQVYIPAKQERIGVNPTVKKNTGASIKKVTNNKKKSVPEGRDVQTSEIKTVSNSVGGVKVDKLSQFDSSNRGSININTAEIAELDSLPGIGPSTAQKIIDYRNTSGRFKVLEDIMKVKGIGKSKYEKIKNSISV